MDLWVSRFSGLAQHVVAEVGARNVRERVAAGEESWWKRLSCNSHLGQLNDC